MARRRGGGDIAGEIRGAFIRAVKLKDDELKFGTPMQSLSEMMKESLEEDFRGTLNALKGFVPKEAFISADQMSHEEWLEELEKEYTDNES